MPLPSGHRRSPKLLGGQNKAQKKMRKPKEGSVIILMPQTCQKKNSIEKKLCRQQSDFKIEGQELCGEAEPCIPDLAMGACDLSSR
jgi:hypothetical protein